MSKQFDWEAFNNGELVVSCNTPEQAESFCNTLHDRGFRWTDNVSLRGNSMWKYIGKEIGYRIVEPNKLAMANIVRYKSDNYKIVEWKDYIDESTLSKENLFDFEKFRLGRIVVNCKTQEAATHFLNILGSRSWKWASNDSVMYTRWDISKQDTVYYNQTYGKLLNITTPEFAEAKYGKSNIIDWENYM